MKVGVFCEESQIVCMAFRALGHEAYSYDIQDCSGGFPEFHRKGDIRDYLTEYHDLVIFHPVCTFLSYSGVRWLHTNPGRWQQMRDACEFFNLRHHINSPLVVTENPVPHGYARDRIGYYDQIIQPWQFGHRKIKATCLWLKGLPKLQPTFNVGPVPKDLILRREWAECHRAAPGKDRAKIRSKTYPGIAAAMAAQWGCL